MSKGDFDLTELDEFTKRMLDLAERKMPRETRKFLMAAGNKLRKETRATAQKSVKHRTRTYLKRIKRGRVYKYQGDTLAVRVFSSAPHAHLIEYGHRMVTKSGDEVGFVRGEFVFERSYRRFQSIFVQDCEDFIDQMLDEGLS